MISFVEWVEQNHPESLKEGWGQRLGSLALAGASLLPSSMAHASQPDRQPSQVSQSAVKNERARLDAMERVSQVHRFSKNWGSGFGHQQRQRLFDLILKLETAEDHDAFIAKISGDMERFRDDRMLGRAHPDKSVEKAELRNATRTWDYQYMDYIKTLAVASKANL